MSKTSFLVYPKGVCITYNQKIWVTPKQAIEFLTEIYEQKGSQKIKQKGSAGHAFSVFEVSSLSLLHLGIVEINFLLGIEGEDDLFKQ